MSTTWKARVVMFSAWNAKIATSVSEQRDDRHRLEGRQEALARTTSRPSRRISTLRLIEPAASGMTTKIRTE